MSARAVTKVHLTAISRDEFEQMLNLVPDNFRIHMNALFQQLRILSSQPAVATPLVVALPDKTTYVTIHPLTRLAASMLPRDGMWIQKFPFRIGRSAKEFEAAPPDQNDLWLKDRSPYNVSRNHAIIEMEEGEVILKDCGSSLGTIVNEHHIGGISYDHEIPLDEGENIVIFGGFMSKFQFRINVEIV